MNPEQQRVGEVDTRWNHVMVDFRNNFIENNQQYGRIRMTAEIGIRLNPAAFNKVIARGNGCRWNSTFIGDPK